MTTQQLDNKKLFLVFTSDEYMSADSFEIEGIHSTLELAHKISRELLNEYGNNVKVIIRTATLDVNVFSNFEIFSYESGLEWKAEDSDTELGFLANPEDEDEDEEVA